MLNSKTLIIIMAVLGLLSLTLSGLIVVFHKPEVKYIEHPLPPDWLEK